MVVVIMPKGGTGNVMFQVGAAWAHAQATGQTLVIVSDKCTGKILGHMRRYQAKKAPKGVKRRHIEDDAVGVVATLQNDDREDVIFEGYFQDPAHFKGMTTNLPFLRSLPRVVGPLDGLARPVVGLHVRGGDYRTAANLTNYTQLSWAYYQRALRAVTAAGVSPATIAVFTNGPDPPWMGELGAVRLRYPSADDEMLAMGQCDALVTANSTFSWWSGLFLHLRDKSAPVVIPDIWFGPGLAGNLSYTRLLSNGVGRVIVEPSYADADLATVMRTHEACCVVPPQDGHVFCKATQLLVADTAFRSGRPVVDLGGSCVACKTAYVSTVKEKVGLSRPWVAKRDGWVTTETASHLFRR